MKVLSNNLLVAEKVLGNNLLVAEKVLGNNILCLSMSSATILAKQKQSSSSNSRDDTTRTQALRAKQDGLDSVIK